MRKIDLRGPLFFDAFQATVDLSYKSYAASFENEIVGRMLLFQFLQAVHGTVQACYGFHPRRLL